MAVLLLASTAGAQGTLAVVPAGVSPSGEAVVAIAVDTSAKLTALVADLEFDPALCERIGAQSLARTERVTLGREQVVVDPEEAFGCAPGGRLSLVLIDLVPRADAGEAVIAAGSGEIARWTLLLTGSAPAAKYPITVHIRAARDGPQDVALQTLDGFLTCAGNCNGDDQVTVSELITGVNVANGNQPASACTPLDTNRNDAVVINELIAAVNNLLNGCTASR